MMPPQASFCVDFSCFSRWTLPSAFLVTDATSIGVHELSSYAMQGGCRSPPLRCSQSLALSWGVCSVDGGDW